MQNPIESQFFMFQSPFFHGEIPPSIFRLPEPFDVRQGQAPATVDPDLATGTAPWRYKVSKIFENVSPMRNNIDNDKKKKKQ